MLSQKMISLIMIALAVAAAAYFISKMGKSSPRPRNVIVGGASKAAPLATNFSRIENPLDSAAALFPRRSDGGNTLDMTYRRLDQDPQRQQKTTRDGFSNRVGARDAILEVFHGSSPDKKDFLAGRASQLRSQKPSVLNGTDDVNQIVGKQYWL